MSGSMHDDAAAALFGSVVQPSAAALKACPSVSTYRNRPQKDRQRAVPKVLHHLPDHASKIMKKFGGRRYSLLPDGTLLDAMKPESYDERNVGEPPSARRQRIKLDLEWTLL
ncbi:hypothetical protein [Caballeronia cordobensis]|uniref:hypothetical protein n=1 Tax=Caballeronia cordobensis TaxID=1353886 RepID=UPI00128F7E9F|nr:hypothetical protein [Caballeronia cordobensis]